MLFSSRTAYPIGFDISDLSLKLIQLKKSGSKIKIKAMGRVEIPPGIIELGVIKNPEELVKIITKFTANPGVGKIDTNEAVVCLPEYKTFLKIIEIDRKNEDLKEQIKTELKKHIPFDIESIYYDWQIIKTLPKKYLIFVGVSTKDIVNQYIKVLEQAKLSVVALEPEPISICRSILAEEKVKFKGDQKGGYAIIDIGATNASLTVYSEKTIVFTASVPISGQVITEKIAKAMKLTPEKAEKIKIIYSLEEEGKEKPEVSKILSETLSDLMLKIKETINFYNEHYSNWGKIEKILLCGGGANFKNLEKLISIETGIETSRGDALINLGMERDKFINYFQKTYSIDAELTPKDSKKKSKKNKIIKISQDLSPTFATTIGLALRGIFIDDF